MEVKMTEAITDAVDKARFVLKMMLPKAYKKQQVEDL